jgi:hypothetical protein
MVLRARVGRFADVIVVRAGRLDVEVDAGILREVSQYALGSG